LLFSLGLCMCLLPEWDLFVLGVIFAAVGGVSLSAIGIVALVKNSKNRARVNWKLIAKISYGVVSSLILGLGMCMVMVWNLIIFGIIIGIVGIVMLLFLIPMFLGFKK